MPNLMINGVSIDYTLTRKSKKNINIKIKNNGEVCVSAPRYVNKKDLENILMQKSEWIISSREKVISKIPKKTIEDNTATILGSTYPIKIIDGDINKVYIHDEFLTLQIKSAFVDNKDYINKFFNAWKKDYEYLLCDKLVDKYLDGFKKFSLTKPSLTIREMTTRWGSCIPAKSKITINKRLIDMPIDCLEYVVLHEVSHLIEANHSKNFYALIESQMPDWKERKKLLNK